MRLSIRTGSTIDNDGWFECFRRYDLGRHVVRPIWRFASISSAWWANYANAFRGLFDGFGAGFRLTIIRRQLDQMK
jgi:hypothetical protein